MNEKKWKELITEDKLIEKESNYVKKTGDDINGDFSIRTNTFKVSETGINTSLPLTSSNTISSTSIHTTGNSNIGGNLNVNGDVTVKKLIYEKPPTPIVNLAQNGENVDISVQYNSSPLISRYEIWNAVADEFDVFKTEFSKISEIPAFNIASDFTVIDDTMKANCRMYYRVYTVNNDEYSDSYENYVDINVDVPSPTDMKIEEGLGTFLITITDEQSRFLKNYNLYVQNSETIDGISTSDEPPENIQPINIGKSKNYIYSMPLNTNNFYFKFWLKSVVNENNFDLEDTGRMTGTEENIVYSKVTRAIEDSSNAIEMTNNLSTRSDILDIKVNENINTLETLQSTTTQNSNNIKSNSESITSLNNKTEVIQNTLPLKLDKDSDRIKIVVDNKEMLFSNANKGTYLGQEARVIDTGVTYRWYGEKWVKTITERSIESIEKRGYNIVENGNGEMCDNTNFSKYWFDDGREPDGTFNLPTNDLNGFFSITKPEFTTPDKDLPLEWSKGNFNVSLYVKCKKNTTWINRKKELDSLFDEDEYYAKPEKQNWIYFGFRYLNADKRRIDVSYNTTYMPRDEGFYLAEDFHFPLSNDDAKDKSYYLYLKPEENSEQCVVDRWIERYTKSLSYEYGQKDHVFKHADAHIVRWGAKHDSKGRSYLCSEMYYNTSFIAYIEDITEEDKLLNRIPLRFYNNSKASDVKWGATINKDELIDNTAIISLPYGNDGEFAYYRHFPADNKWRKQEIVLTKERLLPNTKYVSLRFDYTFYNHTYFTLINNEWVNSGIKTNWRFSDLLRIDGKVHSPYIWSIGAINVIPTRLSDEPIDLLSSISKKVLMQDGNLIENGFGDYGFNPDGTPITNNLVDCYDEFSVLELAPEDTSKFGCIRNGVKSECLCMDSISVDLNKEYEISFNYKNLSKNIPAGDYNELTIGINYWDEYDNRVDCTTLPHPALNDEEIYDGCVLEENFYYNREEPYIQLTSGGGQKWLNRFNHSTLPSSKGLKRIYAWDCEGILRFGEYIDKGGRGYGYFKMTHYTDTEWNEPNKYKPIWRDYTQDPRTIIRDSESGETEFDFLGDPYPSWVDLENDRVYLSRPMRMRSVAGSIKHYLKYDNNEWYVPAGTKIDCCAFMDQGTYYFWTDRVTDNEWHKMSYKLNFLKRTNSRWCLYPTAKKIRIVFLSSWQNGCDGTTHYRSIVSALSFKENLLSTKKLEELNYEGKIEDNKTKINEATSKIEKCKGLITGDDPTDLTEGDWYFKIVDGNVKIFVFHNNSIHTT